jgi:ubiquinone/menaquinone biosynthesis C-methylase UbiE
MLFAEAMRTTEQQHMKKVEASKVHRRVSAQFGPAAAAYSHSLVHSDRSALRKVVELACAKPGDLALDIATGAGHTALALAPHVTEVIAYDVTQEMLLETKGNAIARRLTNVVTRKGIAEDLPFPDSTFDIVTVRQAPHHFANVHVAIREMARVAKKGARLVIVDSTSPEDASLNRQWNRLEKLRDPSHVRNYRPSEWRALVASAGLDIRFEEVGFCTENGRPMSFAAWTERINTPSEAVDELTQLFRNAAPALVQALRIQIIDDAILFCVPQISIGAVKR